MSSKAFLNIPLILVIAFIGACTPKTGGGSNVSAMSPEQLKERGKAIYISSCIACHNVDPSKEGSVGPAISGSSLELISARVLKASYPANYKPKRVTGQMPALPHLEKELPALQAYLNSLNN